MVGGFEELDVWKRAVELSAEIYRETSQLRDFGFRDQITRAGLSIPSNIAEGMERSTSADQCKFLDYARASCGESSHANNRRHQSRLLERDGWKCLV